MPNRRCFEGPEPTLPAPPGQLPGIEEMGGGYYLDPDFIDWQIQHGYDPHLERYPDAAIALLEYTRASNC